MWSQTAGAGWFVFKDVASTVLDEVWYVSKVLGLTELDIWLNLSRTASVFKTKGVASVSTLYKGSYLYHVIFCHFNNSLHGLHHNEN